MEFILFRLFARGKLIFETSCNILGRLLLFLYVSGFSCPTAIKLSENIYFIRVYF